MKSVLITGASTGIGRATALHLDGRGWRVFAGVRKEEDAASLREAGSDRVEPLMLDVTDAGQIVAAAERIGAETGPTGLDGLVNNAGIAVPGPLETLPIEDFKRQIEVNLNAQVAVTQAMLPATATSTSTARRSTPTARWRGRPASGGYRPRRSRPGSSMRSALAVPASATSSALTLAARPLPAVSSRTASSTG